MDTISIDELLRSMGLINAAAQVQGRGLLERHGLTSPRKMNISIEKAPLARTLFDERAILLCGHPGCHQLALPQVGKRELIVVAPAACRICAGSGQRRAILLLAHDLLGAKKPRLLLIGGTPPQQRELSHILAEGGVTLRAVEGLGRAHNTSEAARLAAWADVLVIWAATPIKHKVSQVYADTAPPRTLRITVVRRGIESLCADIRTALSA